MRRVVIAALSPWLALAPAFAGDISPGSAQPLGSCESQKLIPDQLEACLSKDANQRKKTEEQHKKITFPVVFTSNPRSGYIVITADPYDLNSASYAEISSLDGREIIISTGSTGPCLWCKFVSNSSTTIPSERIIGWRTSDSQFQNASGVASLLPSALIFPPMLLAAPFMLTTTTEYAYQITYLDPLGETKTIYLKVQHDNPREISSLFRVASGLPSGQARDSSEMKPLYESALKEINKNISAIRKAIETNNRLKPWCSSFQAAKYPESYNRLKELEAKAANFKKLIGEPTGTAATTPSSVDQSWSNYLLANPGMSARAKANPVAAQKLSICPK